MNQLVDPSPGPRPLYAQVVEMLLHRLADGHWRPGERLPSEFALAAEFGVSQGTVRKALDRLAARRLVERRQGSGTFVTRLTREHALLHFFHLVDADGVRHAPTSEVRARSSGVARPAERARLGLVPGERVVRIRRVRAFDQVPAIAERISVPAALFPGLESLSRAAVPNMLYEFYEAEHGVTVAAARERLRATGADEESAVALGLAVGAPLLEIDRVALDMQRRAVEWRVSLCDTRAVYYESRLE